MIAERLISWAETIAVVYAILLASYVASCLVVGRLNRRIAAAKIQSRQTPPSQIRRDQRQSLVSLAAIAVLWPRAPLAPSDGDPGHLVEQ
jgi:hypothetical protein